MKWIVPKSEKLIAFLQGVLGSGYSGKKIRRLLEENSCRVNGSVERFSSVLLQKGDCVEFALEKGSSPSSFKTIYEDAFLKVVDKPPHWVCNDQEALRTFGKEHFLVHRLDKDTTGLLLLAKSPLARDRLSQLFEERSVQKQYVAVVDGVPKEQKGTRRSLLAKKSVYQGQTIWGSHSRGLSAVTHWETLARGNKGSLLLVAPETGRTHQIRVHLSEMGHPILIDRQYAISFRCRLFIRRPLLHAYRLRFVHPFRDQLLDFRAPLPRDICEAVLQLGIESTYFREFSREEEQENGGNQHHDDKHAEEVR